MTSIHAVTMIFLLGALALAALSSCVYLGVRSAPRRLTRRALLRNELSGDWWARFERDLHAYTAKGHRRGMHHHGASE